MDNIIMDVKNNEKKYLIELQKFFDLTDNIEDEKLRKVLYGTKHINMAV